MNARRNAPEVAPAARQHDVQAQRRAWLPASITEAEAKASPAYLLHGKALTQATYELVATAQRFVLLASPFVRPSEYMRALLWGAKQRGVSVVILCRVRELDRAQLEPLAELGATFFDVPKLHSKLAITDRGCIVSSANLTVSSEVTLIETGTFYESSSEAHRSAARTAVSIAKNAAKVRAAELVSWVARSNPNKGFCIRCRSAVPLQSKRPYCKCCFKGWASAGRPDLAEHFCHQTGRKATTRFESPVATLNTHGGDATPPTEGT
jgi:phosphatidylserine/phosphatidylglycerophosphate/cardiolipin synthase-like enzyme